MILQNYLVNQFFFFQIKQPNAGLESNLPIRACLTVKRGCTNYNCKDQRIGTGQYDFIWKVSNILTCHVNIGFEIMRCKDSEKYISNSCIYT